MQNQASKKDKKKINWDKYLPKKQTEGSKSKKKGMSYKKTKEDSKQNKQTIQCKPVKASKTVKSSKPVKKEIVKKGSSKKDKAPMLELYYMTEKEISSKQLLESIEENETTVVQVWDEIGVASIEFGESGSVDFVMCNDIFEYEEDLEFINEHNIKTSFEVSLEERNMYVVAKWFLEILNQHGGFFCSDSDDFTPIYNADDIKQWK